MAETGYPSPEHPPWPGFIEAAPAPRTRSIWPAALYVGLTLTIAAVAALVLSQAHGAGGRTLRVMSGSMRPTLAVGQVVNLDSSAYASASPQIGDVIAFRAPDGASAETPVCGITQPAGAVCPQPTPGESDQIFIKRVVAGPGDLVSVLDGAIIRDGAREQDPFAAACGGGAACNFPTPVRVPAGEWFVMGDNRTTSDDSRYWVLFRQRGSSVASFPKRTFLLQNAINPLGVRPIIGVREIIDPRHPTGTPPCTSTPNHSLTRRTPTGLAC